MINFILRWSSRRYISHEVFFFKTKACKYLDEFANSLKESYSSFKVKVVRLFLWVQFAEYVRELFKPLIFTVYIICTPKKPSLICGWLKKNFITFCIIQWSVFTYLLHSLSRSTSFALIFLNKEMWCFAYQLPFRDPMKLFTSPFSTLEDCVRDLNVMICPILCGHLFSSKLSKKIKRLGLLIFLLQILQNKCLEHRQKASVVYFRSNLEWCFIESSHWC